jgi:Cu(I)/Ag(I) efflux system membrane fusion protein
VIARPKRRHAIVWSAVAGAALLVIGLRAAETKAPAAAAEQAAVTVLDKMTLQLSDEAAGGLTTAKAVTTGFPETLGLMGAISVVENRVTVVPARVAGRVDTVLKVTGEAVKAGDPLVLLYSPDYLAAREEYLQGVQDAAAKGQPAGSDLEGFAELARQKLVTMGLSPADIVNLASTVGENHLVVRALKDGVITSVNTVVGNMQNQGDTLITTSNLDQVWFSGDLYTEDLPKAHMGQKVLINAEGMDTPLSGSLSFISPVMDASARTIKVRAIIDNPAHALRAAMFVQGHLVLNQQQALVVPAGAVLSVNDKTFCFRAVGKNRFEEVPVTVSRQQDNLAGISAGLLPGDEVITKDCASLDRVLDEGRAND